MDPEDFDILIDIVNKVREVLAELAASPNQVFPAELWEPFRVAMIDLGVMTVTAGVPADGGIANSQVERILSDLSARQWEARNMHEFDAARDALVDSSVSQALTDHGLTGPQLRFKKALIDVAYADYVAHGRVGEIPKDDSRWFRRAGRRIVRFLGPSSTALDSLASVIPFGGALAEAAGLAEHAIELRRDRKNR